MQRNLVRRVGAVASGMLLALFVAQAAAASDVTCNLPVGGQGDLSIVFDQINAARIGKGMKALSISAPLTIAAQVYACKLASPETSGLTEASRAAAYVEVRRAGCKAQILHDSVVRGVNGGWLAFKAMDASPNLRRAFASAQVKEIGLGIAATSNGAPGPVLVVATASGC